MACLAGTVDAPRRWVRFVAGEPIELEGRHCTRQQPFTNRQKCSSCPAYRGIRKDSSRSTGVAPNGDPYGLSPAEREQYEDAMFAALDDDYGPIGTWLARMEGGLGKQLLRSIGDPDELERWNAYMRDYRARMTESQVDRNRAQSRERMRRMRLRKRGRIASTMEAVL